mgnify:CR=1 FL=1
MIDLSIIIPSYNEYDNLKNLIKKIEKVFLSKINIEVILVNNGSTDKTKFFFEKYLEISKFNIVCLNLEKNEGYGDGILQGIRISNGKVIAWTHADMQCDINDVLLGYEKYCQYNNSKVLIKGKRMGRSFLDYILTFGMGLICTVIFKTKVSDINAQPKIFSKEIVNLLSNAPKDFSLDLHLLLMAKKNKFIIEEIPVYFKKRVAGMSKGGGGNLLNKLKLIKRTLNYIIDTRKKWK